MNKFWVVVAAAGSGSRFSRERPKQFFPLNGSSVAEITLSRLLNMPFIAGVVLVRSLAERHWQSISLMADERVISIEGGASRAESVLAGLRALSGRLQSDDWVLVHDIARPCVRASEVEKLIGAVVHSGVGAILASPVAETLKRVEDARVVETCARQHYALAQTPQMFRYGLLTQALSEGLAGVQDITDEASAIEAQGHAVSVVDGRADNIKITRAEQLPMAAAILAAQEQESV